MNKDEKNWATKELKMQAQIESIQTQLVESSTDIFGIQKKELGIMKQ